MSSCKEDKEFHFLGLSYKCEGGGFKHEHWRESEYRNCQGESSRESEKNQLKMKRLSLKEKNKKLEILQEQTKLKKIELDHMKEENKIKEQELMNERLRLEQESAVYKKLLKQVKDEPSKLIRGLWRDSCKRRGSYNWSNNNRPGDTNKDTNKDTDEKDFEAHNNVGYDSDDSDGSDDSDVTSQEVTDSD